MEVKKPYLKKYDAVIIGSGSNGIAAVIHLQQQGLNTVIYEKSSIPGGATKTAEITLPGFKHDIGSTVLPMAYSSPFFQELPLEKYGLTWIYPEIPFSQTLENGKAVACYKSIEKTATQLGTDKGRYSDFMKPLVENWDDIGEDVLGPLGIPSHPIKFLKFGLKAFPSAKFLANSLFKEDDAKALFYGAAAHSTLPLTNLFSSSFGVVLGLMAHLNGWPFPKQGAGKLIEVLLDYYKDIGGELVLNAPIKEVSELPETKIQIYDLTPKQLLQMKDLDLSSSYRKRLENYKYGAGVFKIDWALDGPIPFTSDKCRRSGTIHIGFSPGEMEKSEQLTAEGKISEQPYVLLVQPSVFDKTRAPEGKHTAWAYCHVPNGSEEDCTRIIENQIEKAAPGFKNLILAKSTMNTKELEVFNPNLVGGDINGGRQDITQLFTRPVAKISPYKTSNDQVYLCSSSTPPGGGVHGMGGYNAAKQVIKDHFS